MKKEAFLELLNENPYAFYHLQNWLDGKDEAGNFVDEDRPRGLSHTDGTALGVYHDFESFMISITDVSNGTTETDRKEDVPISLEKHCIEVSRWFGEVINAFLNPSGNGDLIPSRITSSLSQNLLLVELMTSFTYWGKFVPETKALINKLLQTNLSDCSEYFMVNLSTAISMNHTNVMRNNPQNAIVLDYLSMTSHHHVLIRESGYELLYVASRLNPDAVKEHKERVVASCAMPDREPNQKPPTFRVKAQKALSNIEHMQKGAPQTEGGHVFENPNAMIGMVMGLAGETINKYKSAILENIRMS